jgi:methylated-DNA-[protein]-cysteine S-methyltransferase
MMLIDEKTASSDEKKVGGEATTYWTTYRAPIGEILLVADEANLRQLHLPGFFGARGDDRAKAGTSAVLDGAVEQLEAYFAGELTTFDLPVALYGSKFQQRVWAALQAIPYGETESYGELAERIGSPGGARAVGLANGRNPIAIVLPCHRVVGSDGSLTGYGGGLDRKRQLLDLELAVSGAALF